MVHPYKIVDLFAGPGGLAEGFSSVWANGKRIFEIDISVEMEKAAHQTLSLRAFLRQFPVNSLPAEYYQFMEEIISFEELQALYPTQWIQAQNEAKCLELGTKEATAFLLPKMDQIRKKSSGRSILIGGPPCQAYSLVGRARNAGNTEYNAQDDHRHFLYREYITVLERLRPAAFVMENVKGILTSSIAGTKIFDQILEDLQCIGQEEGGYTLFALTPENRNTFTSINKAQAREFVVKSENYGVPQSRHRVFVVGIRSDIAKNFKEKIHADLLKPDAKTSVRQVIGNLPQLRSGLSKNDRLESWLDTINEATNHLLKISTNTGDADVDRKMSCVLRSVARHYARKQASPLREQKVYCYADLSDGLPEKLKNFLVDEKLTTLAQHVTRGHMKSDLVRYLFCSAYSQVHRKPPTAKDFPDELAPNHKSWRTGKFADRFRVQSWDQPSTTITSHIAKDGHYYIHPDPKQCRSLTVREAARLQTFPDNYYFLGTRTQQYTQIGNAVPPFLAKQIAEALASILL